MFTINDPIDQDTQVFETAKEATDHFWNRVYQHPHPPFPKITDAQGNEVTPQQLTAQGWKGICNPVSK